MSKLYVYGITVSTKEKDTPKVKGVDFASPIHTIPFQELRIIVGDINDKKINQRFLEEKIKNDPEWLKRNVILHHEIISALYKEHPIIPLKFGTIFKDAKSLKTELEKTYDNIKKLFMRLEDKEEWALKVYLHKDIFLNRLRKGKKSVDLAGLDWYKNKKEEERLIEKAQKNTEKILNYLITELKKITDNVIITTPLMESERLRRKEQIILNSAILISNDQLKKINQDLKKISQKYREWGLRLETSGPWPPYNFVNYTEKND